MGGIYTYRVMLWTHKMDNFVQQLTTWQVVISECVIVDHVGTHFYHLQLTTWRVVSQNYAFLNVPNITHTYIGF